MPIRIPSLNAKTRHIARLNLVQTAGALTGAPTRPLAVSVPSDLISRVTDAVVDELQEWQARPLDPA